MVASYSSTSPSAWRPTTRTLGALFAGSVATLAATLLHGGSLVLAASDAESITEPLSSPAVAEPASANPEVSVPSPGQAAPWTPGAAPQWGSSLKDLPLRRAPVQEAPRQGSFSSAAPVPTTPAGPASSRTSAAGYTAPKHDTGGASSSGAAGSGGPAAPQAVDPPHDESSGGLLGSVLDVTKGLPE